MSPTEKLTNDTFDRDVLRETRPVVVDFYATWCPPCRRLAPVLDDLAAEFSGRVRVFKVNIDDETELAARYRISSVPTLVFFREGEPIDQVVGVPPVESLRQQLNQLASTADSAGVIAS